MIYSVRSRPPGPTLVPRWHLKKGFDTHSESMGCLNKENVKKSASSVSLKWVKTFSLLRQPHALTVRIKAFSKMSWGHLGTRVGPGGRDRTLYINWTSGWPGCRALWSGWGTGTWGQGGCSLLSFGWQFCWTKVRGDVTGWNYLWDLAMAIL